MCMKYAALFANAWIIALFILHLPKNVIYINNIRYSEDEALFEAWIWQGYGNIFNQLISMDYSTYKTWKKGNVWTGFLEVINVNKASKRSCSRIVPKNLLCSSTGIKKKSESKVSGFQ